MKTERRISDADLTQQLLAASALLEGPEATHRKWLNMISDLVFGPELLYIRARAFRQPPFATPIPGQGLNFSGHGYYTTVMDPKNVRVSVRVERVTPEMGGLVSFYVPRCNYLEDALTHREYKKLVFPALFRQFWLIKPSQGATLLQLPPSIHCYNKSAGVSIKGLSQLEVLDSFWDDPKVDQLVVILTGGFVPVRHGSGVRLDFTVVKPPKESEESQ